MGNFSWKTSDTKKAIKICMKAYLLQPNGKKAIEELSYEGYGDFGGVDAFDWLALNNATVDVLSRANKLNREIRDIGIYMSDFYYEDSRDGRKFSFQLSELVDDLSFFIDDEGERTNYGGIYTGISINKLISSGVWVKKPFSDLLCVDGEIKYPLKFSFNPDAVYEELPAAEMDPRQGL